jgi:hypothetical protein
MFSQHPRERAMGKPNKYADINSPEGVEAFRQAAEEYTKKTTASKEAARAALVKLGTHTPDGELTENYKQPDD